MNLSLTIAGHQFSFGKAKSAVADFLTGADLDGSSAGGAQITSPYAQSAWVYIAVSRLAEKISSIPFRISSLGDDPAKKVRALRRSSEPRHRAACRRAMDENIIGAGAIVDLFNRPHPTMSRQLFWEMVVTWNCLRGEFFVLPLDDADQPVDLATSSARITRLVTLDTALFWHNVAGYDLLGWRYTGSPLLTPIPSEFLLPSELIHGRRPNPYTYWRGMSPLLVAMGAAGADYAASQYNKGYWMNNADTGMVVTSDQQFTPEQIQQTNAALRERKRKAGTPDRPLFLWGGMKMDKPQLSGMETTFIENRKMNRQEIGAIFKVPDSIMGLSDAKASALSGGGSAINQEAIGWVVNTIAPLCENLEAALEPIVKSFGPGLIGWFDIESLPEMQEARRARLDAGVKAFGIGVTFNDLNHVYDLGFPDYPTWGNKSFLPFNLQEAGGDAAPLPPEDSGDPAEGKSGRRESGKAQVDPITRMQQLLASAAANPKPETPNLELRAPDLARLWRSHITARRSAVKTFESKVSKVLNAHRARVLAKLSTSDLKTLNPQLPNSQQRALIDLIFDPHAYGTDLAGELRRPITDTLQAAGNELRKEIGLDDPWKMPNQKAIDYFNSRTQEIMGSGQTVRSKINTALQSGLESGETMSELADRIKSAFNDLSKFEATRVARTEVNLAYNDARQDAMADAGIEYKAWLSSHGPHARYSHELAEVAYSLENPIPLDEPFTVGGEELMFPGDDSLGATAANIINCQCIQLAARAPKEKSSSSPGGEGRGEGGRKNNHSLRTFEICGLGLMSFPNPKPETQNP